MWMNYLSKGSSWEYVFEKCHLAQRKLRKIRISNNTVKSGNQKNLTGYRYGRTCYYLYIIDFWI